MLKSMGESRAITSLVDFFRSSTNVSNELGAGILSLSKWAPSGSNWSAISEWCWVMLGDKLTVRLFLFRVYFLLGDTLVVLFKLCVRLRLTDLSRFWVSFRLAVWLLARIGSPLL